MFCQLLAIHIVSSKACRSGGIGRRAGFRCLWSQDRVGSSPISCTIFLPIAYFMIIYLTFTALICYTEKLANPRLYIFFISKTRFCHIYFLYYKHGSHYLMTISPSLNLNQKQESGRYHTFPIPVLLLDLCEDYYLSSLYFFFLFTSFIKLTISPRQINKVPRKMHISEKLKTSFLIFSSFTFRLK